jgi:hypothetical protein
VEVWPELKVIGKLTPDIEKPAPDTVAELIVTAASPVEDKVTVCVTDVFTATLPNVTLAVLRLSVGVATFTSRLKLSLAPPAEAVNVTAWEVETDEAVAENVALVAPAATATEAGTVTAALSLARVTVVPPVGAAALSVTVQESVPGPMIALLVQVKALSAEIAVVVPVPLRLMTVVGLEAALLVIVSWPVLAPEEAGLNCTAKL